MWLPPGKHKGDMKMLRNNLIRNLLAVALVASLISLFAMDINAAFGDPDTSFSSDGIFTEFELPYTPRTMVLQADGKILVAGSRFDTDLESQILVVRRYNANGSVDTNFAWNGTAVPYDGNGIAYSILVQNDGKIVVGGYRLGAARFGGSMRTGVRHGVRKFRPCFGWFRHYNERRSILPEPLPDISRSDRRYRRKAFRLHSDGSIDPGFGSSGYIDPPGNILSLQIRQSRIYVAGGSVGDGYDMNSMIAKYTPAGVPDVGFGDQGIFAEGASAAFGSPHILTTTNIRKLDF